jgi:spermidine/putrescine transport system permease protein
MLTDTLTTKTLASGLPEAAPEPRKKRRFMPSMGAWFGLPFMLLFTGSFLAPLLIVLLFSLMPAKSFNLMHLPTLENFARIFSDTFYTSFLWSMGMAAACVLILLVVAYPLAFCMVKRFGKLAMFITVAVTVSLFVSENIRLYGWVITFMKRGLLDWMLSTVGVNAFDGVLFNVPVIVFSMCYVYFPFMLFPLTLGIAMIPKEAREAATDLGCNRWQVFRFVDLPLSLPGIVTGSMLTFVLSLGAMAESKILGGEKVITIASEIESAFKYQQDWSLGSALSTLLIMITGVIVFFTLRRLDPEEMFANKK